MNGYETYERAEKARLAAEKRTGWRFMIYHQEGKYFITSYMMDGCRYTTDGVFVSRV